jgi:hypothetical protein
MRGADRDIVDAFEQAVAAVPNVLQAQRLFGDPDCLLRVITRDLSAFPTDLRRPPCQPSRGTAMHLNARHQERRRATAPTPVRNESRLRPA